MSSIQVIGLFVICLMNILQIYDCYATGHMFLEDFQAITVPPSTVDSLNTTAYLGRWYQMYASLIPNSTFERNGYCVMADYDASETANAAFAVSNSQRVGGPTGRLQQLEGDAFPTRYAGKFKLKFDNMRQVGDYWITALGDPAADTNYLYPWAIVATPYRTSLYILARDVTQFRTVYQDQVLLLAKQQGFDKPFNSPLETYQDTDCGYPPLPTANGDTPSESRRFLRSTISNEYQE